MNRAQAARCRSKLITYNEETMTINDWCERLNVSRETLYARMRITKSYQAAISKIIADKIATKKNVNLISVEKIKADNKLFYQALKSIGGK